jgi:hypothetical protein
MTTWWLAAMSAAMLFFACFLMGECTTRKPANTRLASAASRVMDFASLCRPG